MRLDQEHLHRKRGECSRPRMRPALLLALMLGFPLGSSTACKKAARGQLASNRVEPHEFVRVDPKNKRRLILRGEEYRFSAVNSYSMLYSKEAADKQFAVMKALGTNALRMWGFWNGEASSLQPSAGVFPEDRWQILDYVIATASKEGIRLILPLANYWDEFGGIQKYNEWAGLAPEKKEFFDREVFYRDEKVKELYKTYVLQILNRRNSINGILYKDDPTILMWEPMNEARGRSDESGKMVADWLEWAAKLIKENDPNHLVGSGTEGFFRQHRSFTAYPWQTRKSMKAVDPNGKEVNLVAEGSYFENDCRIAAIDLCSIHAWPYQWFVTPAVSPGQFMDDWIREHLEFMRSDPAYEKPLYLAEFGWQLLRKQGESAMAIRNNVFAKTYFNEPLEKRVVRDGLAGIGFWDITNDERVDAERMSFDVLCPADSETCQLIRDFSSGHATRAAIR